MKRTVIILFLIVLFLLIGYNTYKMKEQFEDKFWNLNSAFLEIKFALGDLKESQYSVWDTEGLLLPDSVRDLIPRGTCILRLHNNICLSCYAENLMRFENYVDTLFVVGSYSFNTIFENELSVFHKRHLKSINIPSLSIIPADSIERPYLFILNKNGAVDNVFFFEKGDFSSVNRYMQSAKRQLLLMKESN